MSHILRLVLSLLVLLVLSGAAEAHIFDVDNGKYVSFEQMIDDLRHTDFVFIGELHDQTAHHAAQLQVLEALVATGVPIAIGLEMFRTEDQKALDRWVKGELTEGEFVRIFNENWSMWPEYRPIFLFARNRGVPLVGLNIPREISRQVATEGFGSLSSSQLARLPTGVACDVDPLYLNFIRRSLGKHAHGQTNFLNFCEAQMLWDSAMAQAILDFSRNHPGYTVVTLAGVGHSWKFGIPAQIKRRSKASIRVLLPEIPGRIEQGDVTPEEADYLLLGVEEAALH